jgi:hypothetical protein
VAVEVVSSLLRASCNRPGVLVLGAEIWAHFRAGRRVPQLLGDPLSAPDLRPFSGPEIEDQQRFSFSGWR